MKSGWVEMRLDSFTEFSQGIQVGLADQTTMPAKGLVRFIRIIDYTQGTNDLRYVKNPGAKFWVNQSDIVMVRYGTPGLIGRGIEGVIANNLFKIVVLNGCVTNDFLARFLGQRKIQDYLANQGSSTMPALTFKQLGAVKILFPQSLEEQRRIVEIIDDSLNGISTAKDIAQKKLVALDELKDSILHQAFEGML